MKRVMRWAMTAALAAALSASAAPAAPVKLNMPSAYPGDLVQLGEAGVRLQDTVNAISGGEVEVRFFEPAALVPADAIVEAIASGAVDAGWSSPLHWSALNPALALFGAVPFGPRPAELLGWMWFGGGAALMNGILNDHGIEALVCGITAPEAGGWFREELTGPGDLEGLDMRFYGLGAKVIARLGVSPALLAGGEIRAALEAGEIDATEFSQPAVDRGLGFAAAAPHYYVAGWHQGWALQALMINRAKWESMTPAQQTILQTACRANVATGLAEGASIQGEALDAVEAEGATLHRWPPDIVDALRTAWQEVATEESAANPDFARVRDSLRAFRDAQARWRALSDID